MKKPVISKAVIVSFITPYVNVTVGLGVSWLFVHLHVLGVFHITQSAIAQTIAGSVVFGITAVLGYVAAHVHWLPIVLTKLEHPGNPTPIRSGGGHTTVINNNVPAPPK